MVSRRRTRTRASNEPEVTEEGTAAKESSSARPPKSNEREKQADAKVRPTRRTSARRNCAIKDKSEIGKQRTAEVVSNGNNHLEDAAYSKEEAANGNEVNKDTCEIEDMEKAATSEETAGRPKRRRSSRDLTATEESENDSRKAQRSSKKVTASENDLVGEKSGYKALFDFLPATIFDDKLRLLLRDAFTDVTSKWVSRFLVALQTDRRQGKLLCSSILELAEELQTELKNLASTETDQKSQSEWKQSLKTACDILSFAADAAQEKPARVGFSARDCSKSKASAAFALGCILGYMMYKCDVTQAQTSSHNNKALQIFADAAIEMWKEEPDEANFSEFISQELASEIKEAMPLVCQLLMKEDEGGASLPLSGPRCFSYENVMLTVGFSQGLVQPGKPFTSSAPTSERTSSVEDAVLDGDNSSISSEENSAMELSHEGEQKSDTNTTKVPPKPAAERDQPNGAHIAVKQQQELQCSIGERIKTVLQDCLVSNVETKGTTLSGWGFMRHFAHAQHMYPVDAFNEPVIRPEPPMLPGEPGYTTRTLKWLGVQACENSILDGNDSSEDEDDSKKRKS